MSEREMWNTTEAAKHLGFSDETIRSMCEDGTFPNALRRAPGNYQWRIPKSDIDAFIDSCRPKSKKKPQKDEKANSGHSSQR